MAPTKAGNINPQLDVWPKFGPNLAAFFQLNTSHPFAGEGVGSRYLPRFLLWAQIDCSTHQIAFSHESQPLKAKIESILWSLWTLDSIHCFTFKTGRLLAHLNPMLVFTFRDTSDPHWFNFRKQPSSDLAVFCRKHLRPDWGPSCLSSSNCRGCWKNISQNIINPPNPGFGRGEEMGGGNWICCSRCSRIF